MALVKLLIPKDVDHLVMFKWLNCQFGCSGGRWKMIELREIHFKDSRDALLFSLRWTV